MASNDDLFPNVRRVVGRGTMHTDFTREQVIAALRLYDRKLAKLPSDAEIFVDGMANISEDTGQRLTVRWRV